MTLKHTLANFPRKETVNFLTNYQILEIFMDRVLTWKKGFEKELREICDSINNQAKYPDVVDFIREEILGEKRGEQ